MTSYYRNHSAKPNMEELKEVKKNSMSASRNIYTLNQATKAFVAQYFTTRLNALDGKLSDKSIPLDIRLNEYGKERDELINDYNSLSAEEFLSRRGLYVHAKSE